MAYVHLHTHSHYSFLQALPKIDELVEKAKAEGMEALALTDAGNLHGAIDFYKYATKKGIKPIIGVDAYIAPGSRLVHDSSEKRSRLVLLAENMTGYENLLKLVTASCTDGMYERPRMDRDVLKQYADGLIALIPSFAGASTQALAAGDENGARAVIAEYQSIFGKEDVYLELTHHPKIAGHPERMEGIRALSLATGAPLVAQHDVYYLLPSDREATAVLRRIGQGAEGRNEEEDFSFVSEAWMREHFTEEEVAESGRIAERCAITFELGKWVFPALPVSEGYRDHDEELRAKTYAGIQTRGLKESEEVVKRIEYELSVIQKKGFATYFMVVSDLLNFAHKNHILTTIRGSVGGSLVTYLIGITNVDPLAYKLPFERFLNPERPSAPDIDMDYADNRRDEMIAYAKEKYGADKVAQIGTFGTMLARAAVRDVARALGHPYGTGDRIAKLIPLGSQGFPMTIERALELEADLQALYDEDDDVKEIIDLAKRIEGCARQTGVHAAGVVISPTPLTCWTALQTDPKTGKLITQYDMHAIEDAGLLKFDFLGIKNLAVLADAVERVQETHGIAIDIENVSTDDTKTFEMLARGETEGTFQLNGSGMTRYLKELRPTSIHDINAMVALYRPGPLETIPQYIERKRNPKLIRFIDERMKDYLEASYGLLVYQDDVLLTAITLGGYSWLEADMLRKAMGKKIPEVMEAEKEKLIKGFIEHGKLSKENAETLWKLIEPFAAYGFNKCLTGDTRIHNPVTGELNTLVSLLNTREKVPVSALTQAHTLTKAKGSWVRENGVKNVYRLTTRSGRTLRATDNHPLLCFDGWRPLGKLLPGMRIATPRKILPPEHSPVIPSHEAAVLGYLLSEGNLCHPHGLYFYSTQDNEIADFTRAALYFPNTRVTLNRSKSAVSVYVGKETQGIPNGMVVWADALEIRGKRALEKSIPHTVFSWSNDSLAIFLGKLWQGDGTVSLKNTQAFYATSSEQLAHDVQHVLLRFSILSTIHTKQFRYRGTLRPGFTIVVSSTENITRLEETIGPHLIGSKQSLLETLARMSSLRTNNLGRGTSDTIPASVLGEIHTEASSRGMSMAQLARIAGISSRLLSTDVRKRGYTRAIMEKTAVALESSTLTRHAESDIFWDEVKTIELDGEEMTYDLSVPELENFIANDIVVHNSHAASYGKVAYQTAYMKANYPVEYMAALLTADAGDVERIAILVAECDRMKVKVLPPDINESRSTFTVVAKPASSEEAGRPSSESRFRGEQKDAIRFGLSSIKNFGEGISEAIITEREQSGPFQTLSDFLCRIGSKNLNKKSLESLIKCGALDSFGARGHLLAHIETLLTFHRDATAPQSQDTLFAATVPTLTLPPAKGEVSLIEKLDWERELLGIYVSGHPLDAHKDKTLKAHATLGSIREDPRPGLPLIVPVLISDVRAILTKNGEKMAFIKLEDKTGTMEAVVFPKLFKEHSTALVAGRCILVKGTVSKRNDELSLALDNIKAL